MARPDGVGTLLREWRTTRRMSQLHLAAEAGVSARHLSFLETGRATPSREMLLQIAGALDVPLRDRNDLLVAAGFAPVYRQANLVDDEATLIAGALKAILDRNEPYPAVVLNPRWDVLATNAAAGRFFSLFGQSPPPGPELPNLLMALFDPGRLRPYVKNWPEVAQSLLHRVRRESLMGGDDDATRALLRVLHGFPGVEANQRMPVMARQLPVLPVVFERGEHAFRFFSTLTVFGTPQDVTAQEIRIECFFPADPETEAAARKHLTSAGSD